MLYLTNISHATNEDKDVRLRNAFGYLRHSHEEIFTETERALTATGLRQMRHMLAAQIVAALGLALVIGWTIRSAFAGHATAGGVALAITTVLMVRQGLQSLAMQLGFLPAWMQVVPIMANVLRAGPDLPVPASGRAAVPSGPVEVELRDVVFTYPGCSAPTLRGVTFRVPAAESLALVGHTGCGKTTIVKLLLRFYDVDSGQILVDGTDVRDWDVRALRATIGAVFQDFARWESSVADNIGFGDVAHIDDRARIEAAAVAANADGFVRDLPDGYDTQVGRQLDGRGRRWRAMPNRFLGAWTARSEAGVTPPCAGWGRRP